MIGVAVKPNTELMPWCDGVTAFSAFDAKSGKLIGHFYADLHPRDSKRGGAWMNGFISHIPTDGDSMPHVGLMAGNFTPPQDGKPSLLTHDEVTTLFHEFGHALHGMLSDVTYPSLAGTSVSTDFVELPSQLYEHLLLQPEVLSRFARHYETGEPIPDALIQKLKAARGLDRKSTRLNSSHTDISRMPSSA